MCGDVAAATSPHTDIFCLIGYFNNFHLNGGTGRQQCRRIVPKAVYRVKNCSLGWTNFSPETCRVELKRLLNEKSCCILLVIYIVLRMTFKLERHEA